MAASSALVSAAALGISDAAPSASPVRCLLGGVAVIVSPIPAHSTPTAASVAAAAERLAALSSPLLCPLQAVCDTPLAFVARAPSSPTTTLREAKFPPQEAALRTLRVLVDVACGLQALHAVGIPHGRLSVDSILVTNAAPGLIGASLTAYGLAALTGSPTAPTERAPKREFDADLASFAACVQHCISRLGTEHAATSAALADVAAQCTAATALSEALQMLTKLLITTAQPPRSDPYHDPWVAHFPSSATVSWAQFVEKKLRNWDPFD